MTVPAPRLPPIAARRIDRIHTAARAIQCLYLRHIVEVLASIGDFTDAEYARLEVLTDRAIEAPFAFREREVLLRDRLGHRYVAAWLDELGPARHAEALDLLEALCDVRPSEGA